VLQVKRHPIFIAIIISITAAAVYAWDTVFERLDTPQFIRPGQGFYPNDLGSMMGKPHRDAGTSNIP
jgi:hypothetical protein